MTYRIVGGLISAISIFVLYVAIRGLAYGDEATELASMVSLKYGVIIDPTDFMAHWRVGAGFLIILASLGLVAGVALFLLRPWSCLVLLGMTLFIVLGDIGYHLFGYARYGFERFEPVVSIIALLVGVASLYTYRKWTRRTRHASNA